MDLNEANEEECAKSEKPRKITLIGYEIIIQLLNMMLPT